MLDQAYEQGCEIALNELAATYGEDMVMDLVKIAKEKNEARSAAVGVGAGLAGMGAAGYGGYRGGRFLSEGIEGKDSSLAKGWLHDKIRKIDSSRLDNMKSKMENMAPEAAKKYKDKILKGEGLFGVKNLHRAARAAGKYPMMGAAGLAGGALTGYAGKKISE